MRTRTRFHATAALIAAGSTIAAGLVTVPALAAVPAPEQVVVDYSQRTGALHHGASGFLYGMNDEGVPSDNLLEPLALASIAQAAPFALQHPGGNALDVADQFFRNGGDYVQIYMQEVYQQWPYDSVGDDNGMADYLPKMERTVREVLAHPEKDRFVYVPFNEPDWIWYAIGPWQNATRYAQNRDRFFADWKTAYELIKGLHPTARIAGPNESVYNERFLGDFFPWAKANGVLPDIMTWHELPTTELAAYRDHHAAYHALEQEVGFGPLPIDINEWGGRRDLSVPGRLIQFMAMFEETKVNAGGQAYWNPSGNLSGSASQTNKPGGGWWLMKMYGDLSGDTALLTPPHPAEVDTMQGVATIDDAKKEARVVVGGGDVDTDVVLRGLDRRTFGNDVHVTLRSTTWSGYDADAPPPAVLAEQVVPVTDGSITVPLRGVDELAAYEIVVAPGRHADVRPVEARWQEKLEAEDAQIVAGRVVQQGTPENWNQPAASNTHDVQGLDTPESSVTFTTTVPADGAYSLGILYGNQTGRVSQQVLTIDGANPQFVDYPATLDWVYRARKDVTVDLSAGTHTITLAATHPELGAARGSATLDRLDVRALPADGAPITEWYEAERARLGDGASIDYENEQQSGAAFAALKREGALTFDVAAPADGWYDLAFEVKAVGKRGVELARLSVDGAAVDATLTNGAGRGSSNTPDDTDDTAKPNGRAAWEESGVRLFLSAGMHRIGVTATAKSVAVDGLTVTPATSDLAPLQDIEAEDAALSGSATVTPSYSASGGEQVEGVGSGSGNTLSFPVTADTAGRHVLLIHYANDERGRGDAFNHNIVTRPVWISVDGGEPQKVNLRNTWSWENFWSLGVPLDLDAGTHTVTLSNPDGPAASFDKFQVAPLID